MITDEGAGLHPEIEPLVYHQDPCPAPSLSATIACTLINRTPLHAWHQHPRLNPLFVADAEPDRRMEIGTAVHKLLLGRGRDLVVIDARDYKTAAAKAARREAYTAGNAPLLRPDLETAEAVCTALLEQLRAIPGVGEDWCDGGRGETEIVCAAKEEDGVWTRCLIDRLVVGGNRARIYDLKTGSSSAAPHDLARRVCNNDYDLAAAFYIRCLELAEPRFAGRIEYLWVFAENEPPYQVSVGAPDEITLGIGQRKVWAALSEWSAAMRSGFWPGYPNEIVQVSMPKWAEQQWLDREDVDLAARHRRLRAALGDVEMALLAEIGHVR